MDYIWKKASEPLNQLQLNFSQSILSNFCDKRLFKDTQGNNNFSLNQRYGITSRKYVYWWELPRLALWPNKLLLLIGNAVIRLRYCWYGINIHINQTIFLFVFLSMFFVYSIMLRIRNSAPHVARHPFPLRSWRRVWHTLLVFQWNVCLIWVNIKRTN